MGWNGHAAGWAIVGWDGNANFTFAAAAYIPWNRVLIGTRQVHATTDTACVVWCGVACCGMVWRGVFWCGVAWLGEVWCGVVRFCVMWYGVVWCGVV